VRGESAIHDVDRQFGPFVVRQFGQPGGQRLADVCFGQVADEFARNFAEPRGMQRPVAVEGPAQAPPALFAEHGAAETGKQAVEKAADVVEQQFVVYRHPPRRHAGRARRVLRIAQVAAKGALEMLEIGRRRSSGGLRVDGRGLAGGRSARLLRSTPANRGC
jgi:hypothetical protein